MKILFACIPLLMLLFGPAMAQGLPGGEWKKMVTREVEIRPTLPDTVTHHLQDISPDTSTSFLDMVIAAIKAGKITAYENEEPYMTQKLSYDDLNRKLSMPTDTVMMTDPITGQQYVKIGKPPFCYECVHLFRILEEWTFNTATGNTEVHIAGVAPVIDIIVDGDLRGRQALFWARYADVLPVIKAFEQLHPGKSLPMRIWDDYFYTDTKPAELRK